MNLQSVIDKKKEAAEYMVSEITHICKDFEKRDPGSKGEQQACEYMADVLKNECGCESRRRVVQREPRFVLRLDIFHNYLRSRGGRYFVLLSARLDNSYRHRSAYSLYAVRTL